MRRKLVERLGDAAALNALCQRIHRIGETEFDEIRLVLRQDELLLPPHDDRETYVEFAALWLELRNSTACDVSATPLSRYCSTCSAT